MGNPMQYQRKFITRAEQEQSRKKCLCVVVREWAARAVLENMVDAEVYEIAPDSASCPLCEGSGVVTMRELYEFWPEAGLDRL
jgi:hypothetical protein